jgi:hypothetical protein
MADLQTIKIILIVAVFCALLAFVLWFQGLASNLKNLNVLKDGCNFAFMFL